MFKSIEWGEDGMTIPATAGITARHVMSILATELTAPDPDGPDLPREEVERAVKWLLALDGVEQKARDWFEECSTKHPAEFLLPPGHPESLDQRNILLAIGIGQKKGALEGRIHDHQVVMDIYECLCDMDDTKFPPEIQRLGTPKLLASLGLYFLDRSINSYSFRETHLVQAGECMTLAALNRVGDGVQSADSEKRRAYAKARWKNDPTQSAKKRATELWPIANREGWEATDMWRNLTGEGHKVAFTTVQKWMPRLRDGSLS